MKKKIVCVFLSASLFFSVCTTSFANPLLLVGKASSYYAIGQIVFGSLKLIGDASSVYDIGNFVYNMFTPQQKQDINNSELIFADGKFSANDEFIEKVKDYSSKLKNISTKTHIASHPPFDLEVDRYTFKNYKDYQQNLNNIPPTGIMYAQGRQIKYKAYIVTYTDASYVKNHSLSLVLFGDDEKDNVGISTGLRGEKVSDLRPTYNFNSNGTFSIEFRYHSNEKVGLSLTSRQVYSSSCDNCPHNLSFNSVSSSNYTPPSFSPNEYKDYITRFPVIEEVLPDDPPPVDPPPVDPPPVDPPPVDPPPVDPPPVDPSVPELPNLPSLPSFDFSKIDFSPLANLVTSLSNKFPFSIPSDIFRVVNVFDVEPKAPVFEVPLVSEKVTLDLTYFDRWANISRFFVLLGFIISLISISKKLGS